MGQMTAEVEALKAKALAEREKRVREGRWGGVEAHEGYRDRPLDWVVEKLGVPRETLVWSMQPEYGLHEWDGDIDPLVRGMEVLAAGRDCAWESATGTGKTFTAACIVLWFLACFRDSIVSTIAPKEDQLLKHIWKEIGRLYPAFRRWFPQSELLTGVLRMRAGAGLRETWAASAFVCGVGATEEVATKAQGLHAEHMLIITEETPGIHPAIMEALYNTRTDDHNLHLALGNPDHRNDALHKFSELEEVVSLRISALDHPNIVTGRRIVPGAIGKDRLAARVKKLGEGSRLYGSRVRGISPPESASALIRWEWCEAAGARYWDEGLRAGDLALGCDVSDTPTGDKSAISRWVGACCTEVESFRVEDARVFAVQVFAEATDALHPVDGRYIGLDSVGVGASAVNELKRLGLKVRSLSGGRRAVPGIDEDDLWSEVVEDGEGRLRPAGVKIVEAERFADLRSQIWWRMREDLRLGRVALPLDGELWTDLTTPEFTTKGGVIKVEGKLEIRKRIGRSPDKGDACVYGNWVRRRRPKRQVREAENLDMVGSKVHNRDMGLERLAARRRKQLTAEQRWMSRMFGVRS